MWVGNKVYSCADKLSSFPRHESIQTESKIQVNQTCVWSCIHKWVNELWLVPVTDANEIYCEILMWISSGSMPFSVRSSTRLSSTRSCSWTPQQTISTLSRCSQLNDLSSSSPMNLWCVWPTWNVRKHKFHFDLIAHASTSVQESIHMHMHVERAMYPSEFQS